MNATAKSNHDLRQHLRASRVDVPSGIIYGATVAKAGVRATGKTLFLDAAGKITRDEKLAARKLPIFTDEKTLDTLLAAAQDAGPRVKIREDHDDSLGARAGFASAFAKTTDGRVVADLKLFSEYRHRSLVLETAEQTPTEIGLSIDFTPTFEIVGDKAMMRVEELHAVDLVDEGAITPDGLLLSAGVDTAAKGETPPNQPTEKMPPSNEEIMAQLNELAANVGKCMAAMAALQTPPAGDKKPEPDAMAAVRSEVTQLSTQITSLNDRVGQLVSDNAKLKKERALLGFRGTPAERERLAAAGTAAEDIEKMSAEKKNYGQLVAEYRAKHKCSASVAHAAVQKSDEGKAAYTLHLSTLGVTGRQTMAA